MKFINLCFILVCACLQGQAQTNYVKNPDFELFSKCPDYINQLNRAKYWTMPIDSLGEPLYAPEYLNTCAGVNIYTGLPSNVYFYQYPHTGNGMAAALFYYDKTPPPSFGVPFNHRAYLQGKLHKALTAGKTYCVSFWVNLAEGSGYAHNKIGAYLDNGAINKLPLPPGSEIISLVPQVYTNTIIDDTANWVQIEGSFVATGNETNITIGVFAPNSLVNTEVTNYWFSIEKYSYYLIDDVSVVELNLAADAGRDTWVEQGKKVAIGRVGDTTAKALNCKWYHKGVLIDSGAIISVNANAIKNAVDTYVVVQTICALVKRDTVMVKTVGMGIKEDHLKEQFSIYPNPSNGCINIYAPSLLSTVNIQSKIYDLLGRVVYEEALNFIKQNASLKTNLPKGAYILELSDHEGKSQRQQLMIE